MKKVFALSALVVLLTGCAIPLPLQIASWALDGISYLATGKSVTDHGISMVAQQDCALWRTVKGEPICSDYEDDAGTVIAAVESGPRIALQPEVILEEARASAEANAEAEADGQELQPAPDEVAGIAEVEGAVWSDPAVEEEETALEVKAMEQEAEEDLFRVLPLEDLLDGLMPAGNSQAEQAVTLLAVEPAAAKPVPPRQPRKSAAVPSRLILASMPPPADRFLVIGSFAGQANARHLSDQHDSLEPTVVTATLDGRLRYRVVVGPFSGGEEKNMRRRLKRAGIYDAWPIKLSVADWVEARRRPLYGEASQLAQAD